MNISLDYHGTYTEHKEFFDELAKGFQSRGHRVGIITGVREKEYDERNRLRNRREEMLQSLGFTPDFVCIWGEAETIANGNVWKVERMIEQEVLIHFDDDARELKKYTDRWIIKTLNSGEQDKF